MGLERNVTASRAAETTTADMDMWPYVDAHWSRFPPVPYHWHLLAGIFVLTIGIVSVIGNAAVIYIFTQTRCLWKPSSSLVVNLAFSDISMMIVCCPLCFASSIKGRWIFGIQACRFYGFCGALFGTSSIMTMTAIAVERCVVICKPFATTNGITGGRATLAILFVWTYSFLWAVLPLAGVSSYVPEGFLTTCTFNYLDRSLKSRTFIFSMCAGAFVAPLVFITFCYFHIVQEVSVYMQKFGVKNNPTGKTSASRCGAQRVDVKTTKTSALIVVGWCIAWGPYTVVALLAIFSDRSQLTPMVAQLPALFAKTAAVYNPISKQTDTPHE